jgi:hypothetical protein
MATPKTVLLPLELTPAALEALELAQEALQQDGRLYEKVQLQLERWQGQKQGPLTELLAALVGKA